MDGLPPPSLPPFSASDSVSFDYITAQFNSLASIPRSQRGSINIRDIQQHGHAPFQPPTYPQDPIPHQRHREDQHGATAQPQDQARAQQSREGNLMLSSAEHPVRSELHVDDEEVNPNNQDLVSMPTTDPERTPRQSSQHMCATSTQSLWSREDSLHDWDNVLEQSRSLHWRESTFRCGWHVPFMDIQAMARAGFYYTGRADVVRCCHCGAELGQWQDGDDPLVEHIRNFGFSCPM